MQEQANKTQYSWRTEPEIDFERQKFLTQRLAVQPDIQRGIYPFKDVKLSRADIEWLLATYKNESKPVDWSDKSLWLWQGLDARREQRAPRIVFVDRTGANGSERLEVAQGPDVRLERLTINPSDWGSIDSDCCR